MMTGMQLGVVFPQREIKRSPREISEFGRGVAQIGFHHILAYDHVLSADPVEHPGWDKYTNEEPFHEPFTLFGYLAALCDLELVTGVVILPQGQTALVAKQAAQLDWLTGGKLRLGVGLGWNHLEYEALDEEFSTRARRFDEQIGVLRQLWTSPSVRLEGEDHSIPGVGLNPLPVQRPIPIWIGSGLAERPIRRAARLADGWMPLGKPGPEMTQAVGRFRDAAAASGRDPMALGLEAKIDCRHRDLARVVDETAYWRDLGATHVSFSTMDAGFRDISAHVCFLAQVFSELCTNRSLDHPGA